MRNHTTSTLIATALLAIGAVFARAEITGACPDCRADAQGNHAWTPEGFSGAIVLPPHSDGTVIRQYRDAGGNPYRLINRGDSAPIVATAKESTFRAWLDYATRADKPDYGWCVLKPGTWTGGWTVETAADPNVCGPQVEHRRAICAPGPLCGGDCPGEAPRTALTRTLRECPPPGNHHPGPYCTLPTTDGKGVRVSASNARECAGYSTRECRGSNGTLYYIEGRESCQDWIPNSGGGRIITGTWRSPADTAHSPPPLGQPGHNAHLRPPAPPAADLSSPWAPAVAASSICQGESRRQSRTDSAGRRQIRQLRGTRYCGPKNWRLERPSDQRRQDQIL